jgi:hypothetical protein
LEITCHVRANLDPWSELGFSPPRAISFCGLFAWFEFGCLFPRSGGEKVYLEAAYPRPRYLATTPFAVQALLLNSTGRLLHLPTYIPIGRRLTRDFSAGGCIVVAEKLVLASGHTTNGVGKRMITILVILFVTLIQSFAPDGVFD